MKTETKFLILALALLTLAATSPFITVTTTTGGALRAPSTNLFSANASLLNAAVTNKTTVSGTSSQTGFNFNDTTPTAPIGAVAVKWQTDGTTNSSAYVPFGTWTNSLSGVGATNTSSLTNIVLITIPPLNANGDAVSLECTGFIYINSGGYVTCPPHAYVNGESQGAYNISVGSSTYKHPWRFLLTAVRTATNTVDLNLIGIVGVGTDGYAVSGGYSAAASPYNWSRAVSYTHLTLPTKA